MSDNFKTSEFSRVINVADISPTGHGFASKATSEECNAICNRFDLLEVKHFEISGIIKPQAKMRYILEAKLNAEVVQACIITLDPIKTAFEQAFKLVLQAQEDSGQEKLDEAQQFDPEEKDPPLSFSEDKINFGECAVQYFSECLEFYPRKSDASFENEIILPDENHKEKRDNPFKVLQKLKPQ